MPISRSPALASQSHCQSRHGFRIAGDTGNVHGVGPAVGLLMERRVSTRQGYVAATTQVDVSTLAAGHIIVGEKLWQDGNLGFQKLDSQSLQFIV